MSDQTSSGEMLVTSPFDTSQTGLSDHASCAASLATSTMYVSGTSVRMATGQPPKERAAWYICALYRDLRIAMRPKLKGFGKRRHPQDP